MKMILRVSEAGKHLYRVELFTEHENKRHLNFQIFVDKLEIDIRIVKDINKLLAKKYLKAMLELNKN